ncbi:MAG: tetratricopeptide repeat protein [Candidatus Omnitrophica bacterium]|nr:tetratricopeptide repeat protein [Candidatus Omnitrophota bacterium]
MRKETMLFRLVLISGLMFFSSVQLYAQSVVLNEIEVKEDNSAVKILYGTNRSVAVECYDLSVPPQIVVDFMGDVYSNQPEVTMINKGVVKQMRVIKGTKTSPDLDAAYYSIDFIIIDLKESVRYDFSQGLTNSVLMISKPGMPLPVAKVEKKEITLPVVVEKEVNVVKTPVALEEKEYEQSDLLTKNVAMPKESIEKTSVRQRKPSRKPAKESVKKEKMPNKIKSSIGSWFTFGKAKKDNTAQIQAKEKKAAAAAEKRERRARKISETKADKEIAVKELSSRRKTAQTSKKKREPKVKTSRKRTDRRKKTVNTTPNNKQMGNDPLAQVEEAKQKVDAAKEMVAMAQEKVDAAVAQIIVSQKDADTIKERIEFAKAKNELAKNAYDKSVEKMKSAKSAANSTWLEYSNAKEKLSLCLEKGAEAITIDEAQKNYDARKSELEKVIKAAEAAKKENDAKIIEYNNLKRENDNLLTVANNPNNIVAQAKEDYAAKEDYLKAKTAALKAAEDELEAANFALKKYELEKSEEEYRKSLDIIDSQFLKQMEADQKKIAEQKRLAEESKRKKEEEEEAYSASILKQLEDEKNAAARTRLETQKAKEDAQLAALKALDAEQKSKVEVENKRASRRVPKSRTVKVPERRVVKADNGLRSEVLESAVELRNAGLEMQRNGDFDSAVKYYQQALMQDPKYATVHNDLGILYEQKGLEEKAKMEYLTTLKIDPQYIKAHSNLALLYEKLGDDKKAYYHWKQRVNLGREDDPWTLKAKQRMQLLENRK